MCLNHLLPAHWEAEFHDLPGKCKEPLINCMRNSLARANTLQLLKLSLDLFIYLPHPPPFLFKAGGYTVFEVISLYVIMFSWWFDVVGDIGDSELFSLAVLSCKGMFYLFFFCLALLLFSNKDTCSVSLLMSFFFWSPEGRQDNLFALETLWSVQTWYLNIWIENCGSLKTSLSRLYCNCCNGAQ